MDMRYLVSIDYTWGRRTLLQNKGRFSRCRWRSTFLSERCSNDSKWGIIGCCGCHVRKSMFHDTVIIHFNISHGSSWIARNTGKFSNNHFPTDWAFRGAVSLVIRSCSCASLEDNAAKSTGHESIHERIDSRVDERQQVTCKPHIVGVLGESL